MRSARPGSSTSGVEFLGLAADGIRLRLDGETLLLAFADFPWFRGASVEDLAHVERPSPGHLCWPALDVDLSVESIRDPGRFPLVSRA